MSPATTVRSLDDRLDEFEKSFVEFRAQVNSTITLLKWVGAFAATAFLAVVVQMFTVAYSAGSITQQVQNQAADLKRLDAQVQAQAGAINAQSVEIKRVDTQLQFLTLEVRRLVESVEKQGRQIEAQGRQIELQAQELKAIRERLPAPKP